MRPPAARNGAICTLTRPRAGDRGDEARAGRLDALVERVLQLVERVHDLLAIEQAEHRASQADRRGCRAEKRARLLVVKKDAPFRVAQQDALRQVRHDRRQPVALLFQARARFGDFRLHVALHAVVGGRQPIDLRGERAELGRARGVDAVARVGREHHARLLGERVRRGHVALEQPRNDPAAGHQQHGGDEAEHRRLCGEQ